MAQPKIKIMIAAHKQYRMPEDPMYLPVRVGAHGKPEDFGYQRDDQGENISSLNPSFCELTALYWGWKNLDADYIGLAHYRRHFCLKKKGKDPFENILTSQELESLLARYCVFVPNKRKYYIETLYSHYSHTHYAEQLDQTRSIIERKYPEYRSVYDKVVKQTYGYMFNMMIMRKDLVDQYCSWLFDILFTLKDELKMPDLDFFQGRFYGRVSEILFNVWLAYQIQTGIFRKDQVKELRCISMEPVNWWVKGTAFLKAKFFHKKYDKSF